MVFRLWWFLSSANVDLASPPYAVVVFVDCIFGGEIDGPARRTGRMVDVKVIAPEGEAAKDGCDGIRLAIGEVNYLSWHLWLGTRIGTGATIAQHVRRRCCSMIRSGIRTLLKER